MILIKAQVYSMASDPRADSFLERIVPFLSRLLEKQLENLKNSDWGQETTAILLAALKIFNVAISTGIPTCLNDQQLLANWMHTLGEILHKPLPARLAEPTEVWDVIFEREREPVIKLKRVTLQIASR